MGYRKIQNLYKDKRILLFKECYALEKIHGTSAHVSYKNGQIHFYAGGCKHSNFIQLFNEEDLKRKIESAGHSDIVLFGEAYGSKLQRMSRTYGDHLKFIVFEVRISGRCLDVPTSHRVATSLGFEFVDYVRIPTDIQSLEYERDRPSVQAIRNGIKDPQLREGVVLRPILECTDNRGNAIITKFKGKAFAERAHPPKIIDPEKLKVLEKAQEIAEEWVNDMRFDHVVDHLKAKDPDFTLRIEEAKIIASKMVEDVLAEAEGEIVVSKAVKRAISISAIRILKKRIGLK